MKSIFLFFLFIISFLSYSQTELNDISLEDIWTKYTFYPKSIKGLNSMKDGENYTVLELGKNIVKYNYKTGNKYGVVFDFELIKPTDFKSFSDYEFSNDESKILLTTEVEEIYRHSFKADYFIYDIKSKQLKKISENGKQQLAEFSPDGKKVSFVRDNNIFIVDLDKSIETQITSDGKINNIINGAPDWVYEEEFSFSKGYQWSLDAEKIAFYKFDESLVNEYNMTTYGTLYPEWYKYKYPKAGEKNSLVSIHVYDINTKSITNIDTGKEKDQYIPRIKWTNNSNILSFIRLNRHQNKFELLLSDVLTGNSDVIYTEENKAYVEINDDLTFLNDNKSFIISSEKDGFNHLYRYDLNGNLINQITKGKWDVTKYLGFDEKKSLVYYESAEVVPYQRYIYSISIDGKSKNELTQKPGVNEVVFSNNYKYFINYNSSASTPSYISLHDDKGKQIRVLEDNVSLIEKMKKYKFSKKEFFKFITNQGEELRGWMIKPYDFNPTKQYPVFMYVYGGPGHQTVMDEWDYSALWFQYLAQKGYIVISVDNRGTGARGEAFKKSTYMNLGKLETEDQIEAALYIKSLHFVDKDRIGIMGWSYGGYMSTLCITKGADVFKMAIAVAPVTNWRYYDSIYTERYMRTPQENSEGYDDNSPINHVAKLKGKYLLIHGSADDNVHLQNSMELVDVLVKNNKQFDMFFYPNKNHGIYGGNTRIHLYSKMTDFILNNL